LQKQRCRQEQRSTWTQRRLMTKSLHWTYCCCCCLLPPLNLSGRRPRLLDGSAYFSVAELLIKRWQRAHEEIFRRTLPACLLLYPGDRQAVAVATRNPPAAIASRRQTAPRFGPELFLLSVRSSSRTAMARGLEVLNVGWQGTACSRLVLSLSRRRRPFQAPGKNGGLVLGGRPRSVVCLFLARRRRRLRIEQGKMSFIVCADRFGWFLECRQGVAPRSNFVMN
jgi:hypothetical protein